MEMAMITGMHAVVYTRNAEADRTFFRDVLGFSSVDAGGGWLIFAAPPSELACHPAESNGKHELYLMCDDLRAEIAHLGEKGIACSPLTALKPRHCACFCAMCGRLRVGKENLHVALLVGAAMCSGGASK